MLATARKIADDLGLSPATVSQVKNGVYNGKPETAARVRVAADQPADVGCTPKQWAYILELRAQLGMSPEHWRHFLKKQARIEHERFLSVNKARGVIAGLSKMRDRRKTLAMEVPAHATG